MQLKIVTNNGTFRFNQTGQPIAEINEPFVLVEVYAKDEVLALYDQGAEHLANAFTYDGDRITGMSADAADHIQNFFLAEGAWYLQELNGPEKDGGTPAQMAAAATATQVTPPDPDAAENANGRVAAGDPGFFVPTLEQRQLLREIQVTAEAMRLIEPDPAAGWDRQVQKLLLSQQVFGIGNPEKAFAEGKARLERLIGQAKSSGIPANVVATNVAQGDVPDMEEEGE
jgi:hypothetical protein